MPITTVFFPGFRFGIKFSHDANPILGRLIPFPSISNAKALPYPLSPSSSPDRNTGPLYPRVVAPSLNARLPAWTRVAEQKRLMKLSIPRVCVVGAAPVAVLWYFFVL